MSNQIWAATNSPLAQFVVNHNRSCLASYREHSGLVKEHCGQEHEVSQGGYSQRQFYELIQNGADELQHRSDGRIEIVLTNSALYCANEGNPLTSQGVETILMAYMSTKRDTQIGRFGLGFKSVLNVCDAPEFYSHSGSFRFSDAYSLERVREFISDVAAAPILRLADPIDPATQSADDPILCSMMEWATSVIKLPLVRGLDWLANDIANFPAEFLLFSPHVARLTLTDRRTPENFGQRHISAHLVDQNADFSHVAIEEMREQGEAKLSEWKIFSAICDLTEAKHEAARQDGGVINQRNRIPISWAVPLSARNERSKFWAFFPTEEFITLSGILNAPWKTNSDRQNVLPGPFNSTLLDVTTQIIADALPHLKSDDDPARYLEVLPALNDNPCWGDIELRNRVYGALAQLPSLLNADGVLCAPSELKFHPRLPREALAIWHSYPNRPSDWIHPSNELQHRRARVEHLMKLAGQYPRSIEIWLEALVADRSVVASAFALRAAAALLQREPSQRKAIENARILLNESGQWIAPQPGTVFVASPGQSDEGVRLVAAELLEQDGVAAALESLGIRSVDASARLETLLRELVVIQGDATPYRASRLIQFGWNDLWLATRGVPLERALKLLEGAIPFPEDVLHAKNLAGNWIPIHQLLLPGLLFASDAGENSALIDLDWHGLDEAILKHFGATDAPRAGYKYDHRNFYGKRLFGSYWKDASKILIKESGRRPSEKSLEFARILPTTGPLDAFSRLTNAGQAKFCEHLTQTAFDDAPWSYEHSTQSDAYPKIARDAPSVHLLRTMGVLPTSLGPHDTAQCFAPALARWRTWLPVADVTPEIAEKLDLRTEFGALTRDELHKLSTLLESVTNGLLLAEFYAACAQLGLKSGPIRCQRGDEWIEEEPGKILVTSDPKVTAFLESVGVPFLHASPSDAATLGERWKFKAPDLMREVSFEASGDETELLDFFPALWAIASEEFMGLMLVPCSQLGERVSMKGGVRVSPSVFLREEQMLYYRDDLPREQLLRAVFDSLETPIDEKLRAEIETASQDNHDEARQVELALRVRRVKSLPEKLLMSVGEKAIRRRLPSGLVAATTKMQGHEPDKTQLAELALAVYGVEALHEFRAVLSTKGLRPPAQWAGTHGARRFVAELGFPATFAGFEGARRPRVEEVEGPPQLPVAHPYQSAMMSSVRGLLSREGRRGLLALPTGAGKTRVAVEALVEAIRADGLTKGAQSGPILWIAQSDELCEQAVATWKTLWRAKGTGSRLTISRLWNNNDADELADQVQVVVATIDKLKTCVEKSEYNWLSRPCFVVIDEAHGATTPEYTACLGWLGLSWRDRVQARDRCPLLGLTATAFRGNEAETKRLVDRFGGYRLDADELGDDAYATLQELGVLARVQHQKLDGDEFAVTGKDLEELRKFRRLSSKVEEKLGGNAKRNATILAAIEALDNQWCGGLR